MVLEDEAMVLEDAGHVRHEPRGEVTVHHAVIAGDGDGHHRGHGQLAVSDHRPLLARADPDNVRQIVAVIAATGGEGSIALHRRSGFDQVGRPRAIGHKAGQWIGCVYMQKDLCSGDDASGAGS